QRLRVGIGAGHARLEQAHGRTLRPGVQRRAGDAAPPRLVFKADDPVFVRRGQRDQAVAARFFWAYAGSGLVIQALARRHRMPRRANVARIVSPLTRVAVSPSAYAVSASNANVQRLVGWPTSRGERCSSACKRSVPAASNAAWVVRGRHEPLTNAAAPSWSK